MGNGFRESMAWLHTWAGVVLGGLLFAIFWMGTLSVFDREIDRWMIPATRLAADAESVDSLDALLPKLGEKVAPKAQRWLLDPPAPREPAAEFWFIDVEGEWQGPIFVDPDSKEVLPERESLAGTGFLYPFHYNLHMQWKRLGYWLVGLAAMAMLALLVSGVVIHRKIFVNFFTFRFERKLPRSSLDLHNLTGVLGLPFHFVITLSGLIIFYTIYFPGVIDAVYEGDPATHQRETRGSFERAPAERPGSVSSLDAMAADAKRHWGGDGTSRIEIVHPGDTNAYVRMQRSHVRSVAYPMDAIYFDAATGEVLRSHETGPVVSTQRFLSGLHFILFDHWPLRWLYFMLGLSGCVLIATGYIYWLETRRKRHAKLGLPGVRIVEGLTIGSVTGIVIATLAFFIANRLLPLGASFAGYERAALEVWAFYLVWLTTFAHAWLRPGRAWREQCWAIAGLALLAPVLNWITTGDHLLKTVWDGYWPVAGMDLLLLIGAGIAIYAARKLSHSRLAADEPVEPVGQRKEDIDAG